MERKRKQRDASRLKSYEECMFHTIDLKISKEYKKQKRKKAEPNETIKELESLRKQNLEQAAQIEMMRNELLLMTRDKWHWQEARDRALSTPPSQALEAFAAKVREQCVQVCDLHARGWETNPGTNPLAGFIASSNCAEAIRNLKELP